MRETHIAHTVRGDTGPRVLLLHAIGLGRHSWEPVVRRMESECRFVAPDLPGHGDSSKSVGRELGPIAIGDAMLRLLDRLGWDDCTVVGNSLGGAVGLAMAQQARKRIRGLVLLNPAAYPEHLPRFGVLGGMKVSGLILRATPRVGFAVGLAVARRRFRSVAPESVNAVHRVLRTGEGMNAFRAAMRGLYGPDLETLRRGYPSIATPCLVLHGTGDPLISSRSSRRLADDLPLGEFRPIARCGHFPQEETPDEVVAEIRSLLSRLDRIERA